MKKLVLSTIAFLCLMAAVSQVYARGGGGCVEQGTKISTPTGPVAIDQLKPGDRVWAVSNGLRVEAVVQAVMEVKPDEYVELNAGGTILRVTGEHPVEIASGVFKMASFIRAGQAVCLSEQGKIKSVSVEIVKNFRGVLPAYNLLVAPHGTYIAGGVVVHNKGCFLLETAIRLADGTEVPISSIRPGDSVRAFTPSGEIVCATVKQVLTHEADGYLVVKTGKMVLRVTPEHPFYVGNGTFKTIEALNVGDEIHAFDGHGLNAQKIEDIQKVVGKTVVYNLQTDSPNTFFANGVAVHNKGCFLPETAIRLADGTEVPISSIRPGDSVRAFTPSGEIVCATVKQVLKHEADGYLVVKTGKMVLRVTPEHPFYVGNGTFKTIEALNVGDKICAFDGHGLNAQKIEDIQQVAGKTVVYNLQTDSPNTFFANGVAVHNKGGGCFPAGTMILTPAGSVPVQELSVGDYVTGISETGCAIPTRLVGTHKTESRLVTIITTHGSIVTTGEHPLMLSESGFCRADGIGRGDGIMKWDHGMPKAAMVTDVRDGDTSTTVFNLTVETPHTFVADGFIVHNKGGGGGHGGGSHHSGSHGGSGNDNPWPVFVFVGIVVLIVIISKAKSSRDDENLDYVFGERKVAKKRDKTLKLLEFLARQDQTVAPDALRKQAEFTFLTLQKCWETRDYAPMKTLMMGDLYAEHSLQIAGMIRNHEINMIAGLEINRIDLVNVRYTAKENQREFTALITATACDHYIDDRTRKFLRGDEEPAQFQEFWTFHYQNKAWILREIEQTRESDVLKEENFFEQFTDTGVDQIYGETAGKEGPSGPWLEKEVESKETRTERLLNFLVQTDKLWNRQAMLETSRSVFLQVMAARESGNPTAVPQGVLFPELAIELRDEIERKHSNGITMEFRNLCVRKVELILIRNFNDNSKDEFLVRVRAHAQRIVLQNGTALQRDEDVTPFEYYLTFGRLENQWKLKEFMLPAEAQGLVGQENVDENTSQQQLEWYYQHKRAN